MEQQYQLGALIRKQYIDNNDPEYAQSKYDLSPYYDAKQVSTYNPFFKTSDTYHRLDGRQITVARYF